MEPNIRADYGENYTIVCLWHRLCQIVTLSGTQLQWTHCCVKFHISKDDSSTFFRICKNCSLWSRPHTWWCFGVLQLKWNKISISAACSPFPGKMRLPWSKMIFYIFRLKCNLRPPINVTSTSTTSMAIGSATFSTFLERLPCHSTVIISCWITDTMMWWSLLRYIYPNGNPSKRDFFRTFAIRDWGDREEPYIKYVITFGGRGT